MLEPQLEMVTRMQCVVEQNLVARKAHNLEVAGSSPARAPSGSTEMTTRKPTEINCQALVVKNRLSVSDAGALQGLCDSAQYLESKALW